MEQYQKQFNKIKKNIRPDRLWKLRAREEIVSYARKNYRAAETDFSLFSFFPKKNFLRFSLVLTCFIILITPSIIVASKSQRAGQPLYPFKRMIEKGQINLAGSKEKQDELKNQFVRLRTKELEQSVSSDKEENQLEALGEVKSSISEILQSPDEERKPVLAKIETDLVNIKQKAMSNKVKDAIDTVLNMFLIEETEPVVPNINITVTPGIYENSPTPTITVTVTSKVYQKETQLIQILTDYPVLTTTPVPTNTVIPLPTSSTPAIKTTPVAVSPIKVKDAILYVNPQMDSSLLSTE